MKYLLDSNAWIRLFGDSDSLPNKIKKILGTETRLALSPISIVEICQKNSIGKLSFKSPLNQWIEIATQPEVIELLPITSAIAQQAYTIVLTHPKTGKPHRDPADLLIAAASQVHNLTIVTSDEVLLAAPFLQTLSIR